MQRDVVIHRRHKHEAEQAISDLLKRGYSIIYDLEEVSREGKSFSRDSFGRKIFQQNTFSSCWRAKLRRVVSD